MSRVYHDYACPRCGHVARDHMVEISVGAVAGAPECPVCLTLDGHVVMDWIPQVGRMDAASGPSFTAFDCFDGQNRKVHVGSLKQLRDLERQSEQQARNGEGQPLVFRKWSQNDSNKDVNTMGDRFKGGEQPTDAAKHKFGSTLRKSVDEPDAGYGPGVTDANTSALPE